MSAIEGLINIWRSPVDGENRMFNATRDESVTRLHFYLPSFFLSDWKCSRTRLLIWATMRHCFISIVSRWNSVSDGSLACSQNTPQPKDQPAVIVVDKANNIPHTRREEKRDYFCLCHNSFSISFEKGNFLAKFCLGRVGSWNSWERFSIRTQWEKLTQQDLQISTGGTLKAF